METGISSACRGYLAPSFNNLPTISTQCIDIVMKSFVDRSRDIQGPDSPDWLCIVVCSKLISFEEFCAPMCRISRLTICVIAKFFQVITDGVSTLIMIIGVHLVLYLNSSEVFFVYQYYSTDLALVFAWLMQSRINMITN